MNITTETTTATTTTTETRAFYEALDAVMTAASKAVKQGNADRIEDGDGDIITLHGEGRIIIAEEGEGVEVRFTHPTFTARKPSRLDKFHVMEQSDVFRPLSGFAKFAKLEEKEVVFSVGAEYNEFLLEAEQEKQAVSAPTAEKSAETKPADVTETAATTASFAKELFTTVNDSTQAGEYAVKLGALDPEAFSAVTVNLVNLYQVSGTPENRPEKVTKGMPFVYQAVKSGEKNLVRRLLAAMQATANKDAVKAMTMMYYDFTSLSWVNSDRKDFTAKKVKGHHRLGDVWPEIDGDIEALASGALTSKKSWLTTDAIAAEANLAAPEKAVFVESAGMLSRKQVQKISSRIYAGIGIKATLTFQVWRMIVDGTTTVNSAKTTELAQIKYKSIGDVKHDVERGVMLCALGRAVEYK